MSMALIPGRVDSVVGGITAGTRDQLAYNVVWALPTGGLTAPIVTTPSAERWPVPVQLRALAEGSFVVGAVNRHDGLSKIHLLTREIPDSVVCSGGGSGSAQALGPPGPGLSELSILQMTPAALALLKARLGEV